MRGGSWNNNPQNVRASNRNRNEPTNRNNNIGVRCVGDGETSPGLGSLRRFLVCDVHFRAVIPTWVCLRQIISCPGLLVAVGRRLARAR